jgi:hypothetical protein
MFTEIEFETNEETKLIAKESEGDSHATCSVTTCVKSQHVASVLLSDPQLGSSAALNVTDRLPLPRSQTTADAGPTRPNVRK